MDLQSRTINSVKICSLFGSFDAYTASQARQWIDEATTERPAKLVINLKGVNFIDSTALSVLVHGIKRSRSLDGDLRLCALTPPVRMIFELTRLDKVFEIFNEEGDAVQAYLDKPSL